MTRGSTGTMRVSSGVQDLIHCIVSYFIHITYFNIAHSIFMITSVKNCSSFYFFAGGFVEGARHSNTQILLQIHVY